MPSEQASVMKAAMKMRARAAADGVPLSTSETGLPQRPRAARNDAAHGGVPVVLTEETTLAWPNPDKGIRAQAGREPG
jgi:hypothetical protein